MTDTKIRFAYMIHSSYLFRIAVGFIICFPITAIISFIGSEVITMVFK